MEEQTPNPTSDKVEGQLPEPPVEPPEGAVPKPEEGAGKEGAEKETPTPPPERTYSEAEIRKMHSSFDTQMNELKAGHKEALKQAREQLATQQRKDFIAAAEAKGEDVGQAGILFDLQQKLQAKEEELTGVAEALSKVEKAHKARVLIEKYGLSKDTEDELLKAETPEGMTVLALEMAHETTKAKATPPTKTPSGVTTGKGVDLSKATPRQRAEAYFREKAGE